MATSRDPWGVIQRGIADLKVCASRARLPTDEEGEDLKPKATDLQDRSALRLLTRVAGGICMIAGLRLETRRHNPSPTNADTRRRGEKWRNA